MIESRRLLDDSAFNFFQMRLHQLRHASQRADTQGGRRS